MIKKLISFALAATSFTFSEVALASCGISTTYYHDWYEGRRTATGELFSQYGYTAASNLYRLNTRILVRYRGRQITVRINDRIGSGSDLDLSKAAFEALASTSKGRISTCVYR